MYYNDPNAQIYGGAFTQAPQRQDIPWTNPLDAKEEAKLKKNQPDFTLQATETELLQAGCSHRDPNTRTYTLVQDGSGALKCTKCGAVFNLVDIPTDEIEKYVSSIIDILQTTKLLYVNMPPETIKTFFSMIPFLEKVPKLYEIAQKTYYNATGQNGIQNYNYMNQDPFAQINNAIGGNPYMMGGGYQNPYYQQQQNPQYANPQYYGNGYQGTPQFTPNQQGYYADPGFNPIQQGTPQQVPPFYAGGGYMNPPQGQQAQNNGSIPIQGADNKPQQTAPAAPAPKEGEPVTTNKQFQL